MATQLGYGVNDTVGAPALYLATTTGVVTGTTIQMVGGGLILNAGGTVAALTVTLPQNPVDGAVAEITSTGTITSFTVNAATSYAPQGQAANAAGTVSDAIVPGVLGALTALTPAAATTAGGATATVRFKYTLNGYTNQSTGVISNARSWIRIS